MTLSLLMVGRCFQLTSESLIIILCKTLLHSAEPRITTHNLYCLYGERAKIGAGTGGHPAQLDGTPVPTQTLLYDHHIYVDSELYRKWDHELHFEGEQ